MTIVLHAFLNAVVRSLLQVISVVLFILLPPINHIRMFRAIRRHNSQIVGLVVAQQLSVIFRRELKIATDMVIVVLALLACLGPKLGDQYGLTKFSIPRNPRPSLPLGIYDDVSQFINKSSSLLGT